MKIIIPEACVDCQLKYYMRCLVYKEYLTREDMKQKPSWCTVKELSDKNNSIRIISRVLEILDDNMYESGPCMVINTDAIREIKKEFGVKG